MKRIRLGIVMILVVSMLMGMSITSFAVGGSKGGITVLQEYSANFQGMMCVLVEVRNDNNVAAAVSMNATSYDANGKKMQTDFTDNTVYLDPGEYYMLVSVFNNSANATNYDYDLQVNTKLKSSDLAPAGSCIDSKGSRDGNTVKVYGTNKSADIIEGHTMVVFYNGGTIVDFQEGYLSNNDDLVLYPGEATS